MDKIEQDGPVITRFLASFSLYQIKRRGVLFPYWQPFCQCV